MESFRHLALGCCVLSALAGMLRLFWPDNGFKSVINAVLVLYILTAGIQMLGGIDWDSIVLTLRSLPAGQSRSSADFSAYSRELGLTASVEAVRELHHGAGNSATVPWHDRRCVITPVDIRDRTAIETLLAVNAGDLPWCIAEGTP